MIGRFLADIAGFRSPDPPVGILTENGTSLFVDFWPAHRVSPTFTHHRRYPMGSGRPSVRLHSAPLESFADLVLSEQNDTDGISRAEELHRAIEGESRGRLITLPLAADGYQALLRVIWHPTRVRLLNCRRVRKATVIHEHCPRLIRQRGAHSRTR